MRGSVGIKTMDFSALPKIQKALEDELPRELAPLIRMDIDPFLPFRSGSLAASAFANEAALQEGKIVWGNTVNSETGTPVNNYAQAQHEGLPNKYPGHHPKASSQWELAAYKEEGSRWAENAQKLATKLAERFM